MTLEQLFKDERISLSAIARDIGMNPSLMRQYACGNKTPSESQIKRIKSGVLKLSQDLEKLR